LRSPNCGAIFQVIPPGDVIERPTT
jgi:hypothetical protein